MNGNGLGPMNNGNGWCSNPNFSGFGGRGRHPGMGQGRGFGQGRGMGMNQGRGFGQGRGMGMTQGRGFGQGRGMGPGRGMGFVYGGPGYGNRVAFANQNQTWGGGWTAAATENKSEEK